MQDLLAFVESQGVSHEDACDLLERKRRLPSLTGAVFKGRWVSLSPPTADSVSRFNEMLRTGQVPGCMTDSVFMEGSANGRQFQNMPEVGDFYKRECERHGGTTLGKKYFSRLASFPGDPRAWLGSRGEVQRRVEERGEGCDGGVTVKKREATQEPAKPVDVAPHIVERETAKELEGQTVTKKEYLDRKEKVKERLCPPWKRRSS